MKQQLIPRVHDDVLAIEVYDHGEEERLRVGSARWFRWLESAKTFTFAFDTLPGEFTARKEKRAGNWYWYAYSREQGRFHRAYLGKSIDVTAERLRAIALMLVAHSEMPTAPSNDHLERLTTPPLLTKLTPPLIRVDQFVPTHALERLQHIVDFPLTLLSASAGWGKTTVLAQWAATAPLPVAWIALDASDSEPAQFWKYVAYALAPLVPGLSQLLLPRRLHATSHHVDDVIMADVINLLVAADPLTLVLDNYHFVAESPAIRDAMGLLTQHLPPNIHLVLSSRADPPLALPQLRARGQLNELRDGDLRFTREEATRFLALNDVTLSVHDLTWLDTHIAGWITGWQLAALSLQRDADVATRVAAFDGSHRFVVDFLTEEVLAQLPTKHFDFLLHTAILDELATPLCDAVRDATDSGALLDYLKRHNLFIEPSDAHGEWSRYHPLFASMLRHRLHYEFPELVPVLYQRASAWYANQGHLFAAIDYALKAHDDERAVQLLEAASASIMAQGEMARLRHWLSALPPALIRERARLSVLQAYALIDSARFDGLEQCVRDAEARSELIPAAEQGTLQAELVTLQAAVAAHHGQAHRSIALSQQALATLPDGHPFQAIAILMQGIAYSLLGDIQQAAQKLDALKRQGAPNTPTKCVTMGAAHLAHVRFLQGRLHESLDLCRQAEANAPSAVIAITQAAVLYEMNELAAAALEAQRAIDLQQSAPGIARGTGILACIYQARGDVVNATLMLENAVAAQDEHTSDTARLRAQQARLALVQGDLAAARRWADGHAQHQEPDHDEITLLYEHITLARVALASGDAPAALALLASQRTIAEARGYLGNVIEITTLQALAYHARGELRQAHDLFSRALALGEPEGFVRTFADMGRDLRALLVRMHTERKTHHKKALLAISATYLEKIADALGVAEPLATPSLIVPSGQNASSQPLIDPLSTRELEVLRLLAQGASNQDLARGLVIAIGTVKRHVSNIFMKLGVQSRTQAIARAHLLDLVDH